MKNSKIFRGISYILLPILIAIVGLSIFYAVLTNENQYTSKEAFFKSDNFKFNYMYDITNLMDELIFAREENYSTIKDNDKTIYYSQNNINYNSVYNIENFADFLIIYGNKVLTNVERSESLNTVEAIKNHIITHNLNYVQYENNKITSNTDVFSNDSNIYNIIENVYIEYYKTEEMNLVNENEEAVEFRHTEIQEVPINDETLEVNGTQYYTARGSDFSFYTSYIPEFPDNSEYNLIFNMLELLSPYQTFIIFSIPVAGILILMILVYLINSIGYVKGKEEAQLSDFDRLPIEVILLVFFCILGISIIILEELSYSTLKFNFLSMIIISLYIINFYLFEITCVTIIRRIKTKQFITTSWCGRICKFFITIIKILLNKLKELAKKIKKDLNENINIVWKFCLIIVGYAIFAAIMIGIFQIFGFAVALAVFGYILYEVIKRINSFIKLERGLQNIYDGNTKEKLDAEEFSPEFEQIVEYVNDISNGFENAIEESLKSERLKTELITNVSHDIKTPLTSIINYVDLIKKENIDNEKVKEYIDILENKSQRLKKLTEDLVEASKASSGNVNLNIEEIGIIELLNQAIGEYKDKFANKKLDIISEFPKDDLKIKVDSRYMYRIIENLFSNISKYALSSSRVYIEVIEDDENIKIAIKNISQERLNITEEELMQRFVRGDKSRTTEGSGLGLAIARSLTEIQGGVLNCKIDGDLFKVEIIFNKV